MKAREFTINVPINIKINGDGDPDIDVGNNEPSEDGYKKEDGLDPNPVHVPPLQQELELEKSDQGKTSNAISKIIQSDVHTEDDSDTSMEKFRSDMGL